MIGVLKGKYKIIRELGKGGFGTVYLADDLKQPGKQWAIKALATSITRPQQGEQLRALFDKEQKMLSWLEHPAIVRREEVVVDGPFIYLVMEFIDGKDLSKVMANRPRGLSFAAALTFAKQICDILDHLHSQKPHPIIFRDLKPSNLMLTSEGQIKLIDFGIARLSRAKQPGTRIFELPAATDSTQTESISLTATGELDSTTPVGNINEMETEKLVAPEQTLHPAFYSGANQDTTALGTPGYAAPEQYSGSGMQTDARADIYSLGAILFHLLTLENPAKMPRPLPLLHRYIAVGQTGIEELVVKATALDREQRYRTARAMSTAISDCLRRLPQDNLEQEIAALIGRPLGPFSSTPPPISPPLKPSATANSPKPKTAASKPQPLPIPTSLADTLRWGLYLLGWVALTAYLAGYLYTWLEPNNQFLKDSLFWLGLGAALSALVGAPSPRTRYLLILVMICLFLDTFKWPHYLLCLQALSLFFCNESLAEDFQDLGHTPLLQTWPSLVYPVSLLIVPVISNIAGLGACCYLFIRQCWIIFKWPSLKKFAVILKAGRS